MAGSKARQAFLGLVLQCLATFVLISRVNGDTLCFACDKIFHPAGCGNLARCGPHEVCFTVMGTSGASSDADFTSGCMPREDCEGSIGGNLHPFHTELCSQCCHTDLCNAYLCEQKLPNGMICAKCDDVSDVDTCLKVAFCQGGEVCSSTLGPQSNTYTLGCQKKEACTGTTACCDNADLCNLNLTKTISNPRQVSVTSTPSSTTSWPSATDSETIATFESTVGVDHVTPTTVTFFSSVDNNTTWGVDSVSSSISTHGDLSTLLVTSTLGATGSQDVTSEGSLSFSSTDGWSTFASVTMAATQVNKTIPSVVVGGESLCYSCEEVANPVFCSQFQVCGPHETCFTEKRLNSNGADKFSSGCVAREECQDTELDGSRHVHETVECSECCYGDLCNDKLCKAEVLISQTALLCAVCENIPDLHACLRFKVCTVSEVCSAEQTAGGFTLGCRKTEDCTGDVVCCNDTDLCNVKGGSNVHAPSSGKTTPPTTPVSITGPPTDLFLSSTFTEQSSTSSSNADTSSSEFSTSASSSILGTQSLPVETASIAMTSPGDVTVAGTISPELSSASNGYYMTSSSLAVSAVSETTASSLIVEKLSTTTGIASLETFSASEIPSPSTGASEIMMSATRMIDISVSSQPYNRNLSLVGSTAWPTVENFSPSSSKASQTSSPSTTAIEVSTTSTENSEISAVISGIGQVTASFIRPMTVSVYSTDKSEISTLSTEGIEISSTEVIEVSSSSTGAKEMSASAEPYKILYSSVEPSTAQTSVENMLALTSEVSRIATTTAEVNGASSAEPSSSYLSVKQSTAQSGVESFTVSLATVSDVSTSSIGNSAIPTPSTGVMEVSMSSTEEFQILTVSTQSNDISKSSIVPYNLSTSADISTWNPSVGESIAQSLVENLSVSSAKQSNINTPFTGAIEASVPSTKEIDISPTFTKSFDISASFTIANEISVSAQPYSQRFPLQASNAPSSVETFSVSSAKATEGATHSTEALEVSVFSTTGSKISSPSTEQIDISLISTQTNEILLSSSLHPSARESISQSLEEMFSGSFTKAGEITTPFIGVVEASLPSTKEIVISTYLTEIKISALSTESNDISTSFTVANEVSASAEPYSLHPSVIETPVHPLVENLSVASSKSSEIATTVTEAIEVSAPFSTGRSETWTPSTAGIDISTPFTQTKDILVFSSLHSSAGQSISQSIEENLSVPSTKTNDITIPSTGVIEVSVPSTKEIEISTPSTGLMEISAPSTESNDISVSFTVSSEVSASVEPYRQHLSVEESTAPSTIESFSVISLVTSEMTTPYSGAIAISSHLSAVETETSSSFTGQMDILLSSAKETETAMTVTDTIDVSATFYTRGSETSTLSTAGTDISTSFTQANIVLSSLHPSAGESISQSLEENLSVFSTKTSDITTPSTGVIEVLVPSTTEMEISAPSTESNDISVSFTASNEVSASVEPYRQHLSVEESTAPSSVETFSVSSAVKSEMTTPYSGAIEISSPLSIVERDTSSSFTGQTDFLSSVTQAVKVSASAEFYSLYPSAEESISQSLKESFTVSSAKASDIATPSSEAIEVSSPFSTDGSRISATSTTGIDISTSFTQTKEIFTFSSSHPFVGESIVQSAVDNLVSSARGSDITTTPTGGIEVSVPSTGSNDISSSFTVVNEVLASVSPYRQQLSVEQSTPPSSMETFSMSSAVTSEIATPYGGASGTPSPLTAAQIVVSTVFTGQIEILASSTKTSEVLASEEHYSLHSPIFGESLAHSLGENFPDSSVKASDTAMPFTEVVEVSTFVSIGGSQFSTPSTGDIDLSASSQANNILSSSSDANKISASSETYNWPSTAQSNVENFSVSSSESKIPTPTTRVYGASVEPYSSYLSVEQSTAQTIVENYFASLTNINEVSTLSTGSIQVLSPSTGDVWVSVLSTKDIEISTPLTGEITISALSTYLNDISTAYTLKNISADPYTLHPSEDVSIVHTLVERLPVSSTEAIEVSEPFSTDGSRISATSTEGIDISTSFTQTTANFALSSSHPFVGESIVQSAVENLSVSSDKGSDITTTSTGAIEVLVPSTKEIEISTYLTREIKISAPSAESNDISTTFTVPNEVSASVEPYRQHLSVEESTAPSTVETLWVPSVVTSKMATPYSGAIEISSPLSAVEREDLSSFTGQTEILMSSAKASETATTVSEAIEVSATFSTGGSETRTPSTAGIDISTSFIQNNIVLSSLHPFAGESISQSLEENLSVSSTKTSDITTSDITGVIEVSVSSTKNIEISTPSTALMESSAPATESNDISVSFTVPNEVSASVKPYRQHLSVEESPAPSSVETFSVSSAVTSEMTTVYGGASLVSAPLFTVHNETLMSFMIETSGSSTETTEMLVSAEPYSQHFVVNGSDIPSSVKNLLVSSIKENLFATHSTDAIEVSAPLSTGGSEIATPFMETVDISTSFTQANEILVSSISHPSVGESISPSVIENLSVSSDITTPSTAWTEAFVPSSTDIEIFPSLTGEIKISAPSTESNYISWSSTLLREFLVSVEPYTQHLYVEESTSPSSVENISVSSATASKFGTLYSGAIETSAPFSAVNSETSASPIQTTEISNPEPDNLSSEQSSAQSSVENYSMSSAQVINISTSPTVSIGVSSPPTRNSAISMPSIGVIEVLMASTKESEISITLTEETKISVPSTVANAISTSFTLVNEVFLSAEPSSKHFFVKESSEPSTMENFSVSFAIARENATLSTRASADSELFPGVIDFSSPFSAVHSMMSTVSTLTNDISDQSTEISESYSIQWFSRESTQQSSIEILSSAEPSKIAPHYTEMNKSPASSAGPNEILSSWMIAGNEISTSAEPYSLPPLVGESTAQSNVSQTTAEVFLIQKEWDLSSVSPERQTVAELSGQLTTSSVSKELRYTQQASDSMQSVTSPEETNDRYSGQTTEPPATSHSWSEAGITTDLFTLLKMSAEYFYRTNRVPLSTEPSGTNPSFSQTDASPGQSRLLSSETSPAANVTADDATTNDTTVSTDTVTQNDYMFINTTTL